MIGEILNLKNLIAAELNEKFIHCDAQKFNDIVITAAIMNKDNLYLITQSKTLSQPIACNVDREFKKSKFVFISPHLNQIIWISQDSKYIIISITKLLQFINPDKIEGMSEKGPFALSSMFYSPNIFQDNNNNCLRSDIKGQLSFKVLSASWWEPDLSNSFVVFVEKNGINILHVNKPESGLKNFPLNDIRNVSFGQNEEKFNVILFTTTVNLLYTFSFENNPIVLSSQQLLFQISMSKPFFIQRNSLKNSESTVVVNYQSKYDINTNSIYSTPVQNNKWQYYILQERLIFYDTSLNEIKITEFQSSSLKTFSIVITKHLIFYCDLCENNEYKVFARFIQPDHRPIVIHNQKARIHLVSFDDDEVFLDSEKSIVHISLKKELLDNIFSRLVFEKHLDDAIFIGQGLQLSIPYLFQYIINEYVKQKNFSGAFEIMPHEKCDLRDTLLRFLQNGLDRLALHVALKNYNKSQMIEKSIPLFADRVILKHGIFYSFSRQMKQIFGNPEYLMSPNEFSKSPMFDGYKAKNPEVMSKIPLALQFRYNVSFGIEASDLNLLKSASKIDLPIHPVFSFSAAYKSLLNQYRAMIGTDEELMTELVDHACTNLAVFQDTTIFLSDKLYIGNQAINTPFSISSFTLRGKNLYAIDKLLNVYKTELPRIDFIELHEIHPCVKIEANEEDVIVFLSVSGGLFFENGDSITGEFIDIALGKDFVFAVDDKGDFYSISIKGKDEISDQIVDGYDCNFLNNRNNKVVHEVRKKIVDHFVHAIAAAGNMPVLVTSAKSILVGDKEHKISGFECCTDGMEKCYIGGNGEITVIGSSGEILKTQKYNQRIGSLISIKVGKSDDSLILLGSASPPVKLLKETIPSNENPSFGELKLIATSSSAKYSEEFLLSVFDRDPFRAFLYAIFNKWDKISVPNCTPEGIISLEPYIDDFPEEGSSQIFHSLLLLRERKENFSATSKNFDALSDEMIKTKYARKAFLEHPNDLNHLTSKQLFSILPEPSTIREISYATSHGQLSALDQMSPMRLSKSSDGFYGHSESESSRRIKLYDKNMIKMDNFSEKLLQWSVHPTIVPSLRFKEGKLFVFNCNHILNSNEMLQNVNKVKKLLSSKKLPNTEKLVYDVYLLPKIPVQCPKCLLQRLEAYFK